MLRVTPCVDTEKALHFERRGYEVWFRKILLKP